MLHLRKSYNQNDSFTLIYRYQRPGHHCGLAEEKCTQKRFGDQRPRTVTETGPAILKRKGWTLKFTTHGAKKKTTYNFDHQYS